MLDFSTSTTYANVELMLNVYFWDMKIQKGDWAVAAVVLLAMALMLSPWTAEAFGALTAHHPYGMGFLKFALLATMGELLAGRLGTGHYRIPSFLWARILIWGIVGVLIVFNFALYGAGIDGIFTAGLLPDLHLTVWRAFLISASMNFTFGIAFMAGHRISDAWLERVEQGRGRSLHAAVQSVDWHRFFNFVVGKTIPFFWVPAHTITFLLPPAYRVLVAALLSMALGLILCFSARKR